MAVLFAFAERPLFIARSVKDFSHSLQITTLIRIFQHIMAGFRRLFYNTADGNRRVFYSSNNRSFISFSATNSSRSGCLR